jgi:capsular polysaccharide transport system permease protein
MEKGNKCVMKQVKKLIRKSLFIYVCMPWLLFAIYQVFISAPRYESQSRVIVKQPDGMSTMDPSMALLTGLGANNTNSDIQLVKLFIESVDMVEHLEQKLQLTKHLDTQKLSYLSKLYSIDNNDDLFEVYSKFVTVDIDDISSSVVIKVQAYDSEYSKKLNAEILSHSESFINSIGHQLAKSQLRFIDKEHALTGGRLQRSKLDLLDFQRKYDLLDPEAEGMAIQTIAYGLESSLSRGNVELKALQLVMSNNSPMVVAKKTQLEALKAQLHVERQRLSQDTAEESTKLSSILSEYSDLKINLELRLKAYMSSQISLEKSRVEAYRQLKHLITVQKPTQPTKNKYPETGYNLLLTFIILLMLFAITRIITSTIKELS